MIVCDLSSFYCEKGGGVSTYHRARIEWFARQTRHRYILISPGPRFGIRQVAPSVLTVQVYGPPASRDPDRYRLLTNYAGVRAIVEGFTPDVLETHDPWFSLPIGLMLRYRGPYHGLLTTFCHSDPIRTYVGPRLARFRMPSGLQRRFERWADCELHRLHAPCHAVFVASDTMRERLAAAGVARVVTSRFGVDPELFRCGCRRDRRGPRRLLYAGRLDDDKEFGLVLETLPQLLRRPDIRVTIVGTGKYRRRVAAIAHPRVEYLGHLVERPSMHMVYARSDVLLAPGRFETCGLSALEGAAAGLVVVGPSEGGTGELLRESRSPLTFVAGNAASFLDRIHAALDGDHRLLVERERAMAARYGTWADAVTRQLALYESMLGRQPVDAAARIA
jgi:glycosyltransferase involved in cell wall biosynthesis